MRLLVLGSGAREHALAWRISKDVGLSNTFLHPGNAGTQGDGIPTLGSVDVNSVNEVIRSCKSHGISLVVIGPETFLAQGYADAFRKEGLLVVGPNREAAQLETSKAFAKSFMKRAGVPTAEYTVVNSRNELLRLCQDRLPRVLKLDGLAAGKGVVLAHHFSEVEEFAGRIWDAKEFGPGPHSIVVEELLEGVELSYIGLCDGATFQALAPTTDYKRVRNGNEGPNTGGMGAISPSPFFNEELGTIIQNSVVKPVLEQLKKENLAYHGALYIGLMISPSQVPYVLEFNTRFGDPETQCILPRLEGSFVSALEATAEGTLAEHGPLKFRTETSIYVVAAAQNYPEKPKVGDSIEALSPFPVDCTRFYAGVAHSKGTLVTSGGRVLGVGALGGSSEEARKKAYAALATLAFHGMHFRTDIGLS